MVEVTREPGLDISYFFWRHAPKGLQTDCDVWRTKQGERVAELLPSMKEAELIVWDDQWKGEHRDAIMSWARAAEETTGVKVLIRVKENRYR